MLPDLAARRSDTLSRLEELRQARGAALLDGQEFDSGALLAAEAELDALTAAEAEKARRERRAAAEAEEQRRADIRAKRRKMVKHYANALDRAEAAARDLGFGLRDAKAAAADILTLTLALGEPVPNSLNANTLEDRLARRMGVAMRPLIGHGRTFGPLQWPAQPDQASHWDDGWSDAERALVSREMTEAMP